MIADLSTRLVNTFLILLISHFLGVSDMGSYSIGITYFSFGVLFSYWGFGVLLTREVARNRNSYSLYLSNFGAIRMIFAVIAILTINGIVFRLDYIEQTQQTISIISIAILASTIINLINALFIAFEELKYLSVISLSVSGLRLITSFIVLRSGGSVVTIAISYTLLEFVSLGISLVFASRFLQNFKFEFNFRFSMDQIVKALPLFWITVLVILDSRVEILIISLFFNETAVGYYTAMNTIVGGLALFSEGIRNAVFPLFARYQIHHPDRLREMVLMLGKYVSLVTFPIAIGVYFFAEELIFLFFNQDYRLSADLLQIVVWTFIGYSLTVIAIRLLLVYNREIWVVLALFVSGALTVILNLLLAPILGMVGIAIVRLVTTYVLLILCTYFLFRQGFQIINPGVLLRISATSTILYLAIFLMQGFNLLLRLVTGALLYVGVIWLFKVIQPSDLRLWKEVFQNIFNRSPGKPL